MAVVETTSTKGAWKTFSSVNATLATAITEVMNALDANNVPMTSVQINTTWDSTNGYAVIAFIKKH